MASNPFFSGRIPPELLVRIEQRIQETGESKTDILVAALSAYLGAETPKSQNSNLWQAINELRGRLSQLEAAQASPKLKPAKPSQSASQQSLFALEPLTHDR